MSEEDTSSWMERYRSTVMDEQTPALDEVILAAARRRAVRVRTIRRSVVVLGLAAVVILPFWRAHVSRAPQARAASDYGRQEGATRYYLMNVTSYTGPGSMERTQ
jgi:hypothetical protein